MTNAFVKKSTLVIIALLIIVGLVYFYERGSAPSAGDEILADTANNFQNEAAGQNDAAGDKAIVTRIIDGDTVVIEGGESVRLIGIDSAEKNEPCFESAKEKLEQLILNKKVVLEKDQTDRDKYQRYLRYIFYGGKNINIEMTKSGMAVAYVFPPDIKYKTEIGQAEQAAKLNRTGCEWNKN